MNMSAPGEAPSAAPPPPRPPRRRPRAAANLEEAQKCPWVLRF